MNMRELKHILKLKITSAEKAVLLAMRLNAHEGKVTMTVQSVAEAIGCCKHTAQTNIQKLRQRGYIVTDGLGGRGKPNTFEFSLPFEKLPFEKGNEGHVHFNHSGPGALHFGE